MWITIRENERGILWRNGRPVEWLGPGRHLRLGWGARLEVVRFDLDVPHAPWTPEAARLVPEAAATKLDVPPLHAAVVEQEGRPRAALAPGSYFLWGLRDRVTAHVYDLRPLTLEIPTAHRALLAGPVRCLAVRPWEVQLVYVDGKLETILGEGLHVLAAVGRTLEIQLVDLRPRERVILGQELMTRDQVTLRLSLVAQYRIVDARTLASAVTGLDDAIHTAVQLAARRRVTSLGLDELLARRSELRDELTAEVGVQARAWGVEVSVVDVRDVSLPGEMKTLLNQVLEAEKKAAAQAILRREETASTRSMANTAKMLEQSPMLLRMKELEAMRELAERVGHLTVVMGAPEWAQRALDGSRSVERSPR